MSNRASSSKPDQAECGCCFGYFHSTDILKCSEGHTFCRECVTGYAMEAIQGAGKSRLQCLAGDECSDVFSHTQLLHFLPNVLLEKLEEREAEESVALAHLDSLIYCAHCHYAVQCADSRSKIFCCPNCGGQTCIRCGRDMSKHRLRRCTSSERISVDAATAVRKKAEEDMTRARVRRCPKCTAELLKEEGCNQLTCRCGASICYVCREEAGRLVHFCQHQRRPTSTGTECPHCDRCPLWGDVADKDEKTIGLIRQQAIKRRLDLGTSDEESWVGPPQKDDQRNTDETESKRRCVNTDEQVRVLRRRTVKLKHGQPNCIIPDRLPAVKIYLSDISKTPTNLHSRTTACEEDSVSVSENMTRESSSAARLYMSGRRNPTESAQSSTTESNNDHNEDLISEEETSGLSSHSNEERNMFQVSRNSKCNIM